VGRGKEFERKVKDKTSGDPGRGGPDGISEVKPKKNRAHLGKKAKR